MGYTGRRRRPWSREGVALALGLRRHHGGRSSLAGWAACVVVVATCALAD